MSDTETAAPAPRGKRKKKDALSGAAMLVGIIGFLACLVTILACFLVMGG